MNRIDQTFKGLKQRRKKAFIAFITAGDPTLKATEDLVLSFEKSGVDIVELGVPFSDPLADGTTIQASSERALKHGVNLDKILNVVKRIRKKSSIPICLMTYYNPVFHYGEKKFIKKAKQAGVDGLIIPDLPPEEGKDLIRVAREENISTVFFLAPTTTKKRVSIISKATSGFIYFVSLAGVTGARKSIPASVKKQIAQAKRLTKKPVCVGFGISTPAQVKAMARVSDGVIVGSAIVNKIFSTKKNKNFVANVSKYVRKLSSLTK